MSEQEKREEQLKAFYKAFRLYPPGWDVPAAVGGEDILHYKAAFFDYWIKSQSLIEKLVSAGKGAEWLRGLYEEKGPLEARLDDGARLSQVRSDRLAWLEKEIIRVESTLSTVIEEAKEVMK